MSRPAAKALNKPLLIVGIDRKLAGLAFIFAVIISANDGASKIVAVVLSVAMCAAGRLLTRKDPNIVAVMHRVGKQKTVYDAGNTCMVKLKRFLKTYREAGAFHSLLGPHQVVDDQVFLTKGNALGVVIAVNGIDPECLTAETLESYTRRITASWRSFDDRFRLHQYFVKQSHASLSRDEMYSNAAVERTVRSRVEYLQTKSSGLYSVQIYYVILFELSPRRATTLFQQKGSSASGRATRAQQGHADGLRRGVSTQHRRSAWLKCPRQTGVVRFLPVARKSGPGITTAGQLKYHSVSTTSCPPCHWHARMRAFALAIPKWKRSRYLLRD